MENTGKGNFPMNAEENMAKCSAVKWRFRLAIIAVAQVILAQFLIGKLIERVGPI